ncbi:MAG TPA: DEAD/DEAH box helicase [Saprospiraceae bacterium]|nr:DEAD/DEAH box helicase [Saprospiraceae bacterium]
MEKESSMESGSTAKENEKPSKKPGKTLYDYQKEDLSRIFKAISEESDDFNLLYQLPTGGGKTVIFSEIARKYINEKQKKVVILTHRIELLRQTSKMLAEFKVKNKVIDSEIKSLPDQDEYQCFVAMVETLNNRLNEEAIKFEEVGLVIIDEAHYNSFRKLFKFFKDCFILGVTATPLSSNVNKPMNDIYGKLLVGHPIKSLVDMGFLAQATTYTYHVGLGTLKIGANGDYTVRSSDMLYSTEGMQSKLLQAYSERAKGKKTLIFNNGIKTSKRVYLNFAAAGYDIKHVDSKTPKKERKAILKWFHETPEAILTSVGILTTGFDEPTVEVVILNRATRSPTLYYQMIGRGSRITETKDRFDIMDLGNNVARFGLWSDELDWQRIFKNPRKYLETLISDDEIERRFVYTMPDDIREQFSKTEVIDFNVKEEYEKATKQGERPQIVLERSMDQHIKMCIENSDTLEEAYELVRLLEEDVIDRVRHYCYCISNSTKNYKNWLLEEYNKKLRSQLAMEFL